MSLQRVHSIPSTQFRATDGTQNSPLPPAGGPIGSSNSDQPIFRLNLVRALQLHRRMAIGFAVGGLLLAVAYVIRAWPVYIAQSQIYVQPVQSKVMSAGVDSALMTNAAAYDSFVQQQVQSANNPDVLVSALRKLKPGSFQRKGESEQAAAARLGGTITVSRVGTSYEVAIAAKAKDPQLVAQIANAVASSVAERASGEGNAGNAQRIAVLQEERKRIQDALAADYAEQDDLNKQLGMAAVGTEAPDLIDADIGRTREELIKAQTEHDEAEARFAAMGAGKGESSAAIDAEADELVAADAGLTSMKTSLNARRATLITQMANLTPSNPEYKQDAEELSKINGSLDTMMKELRAKASARIQQRLQTNLERTAGVESRLNGQLRKLAGTAASATPKLQRASDLATDINRLRLRFTNVDEQLHNLMLDGSAPGAVHVSVAAIPPLHPTVTGILKKAIPCVLAGLLFGLLAVSIANHLDPKIYIAADIEQAIGFAPMAVLPDFDEVSEEVSAEHLLRLSAAIEHARKQGNLDNCIFTGTSSGVGVTTLVTRVRDILKAMGRATVLLDSSGTPPPAPRPSSAADQPASQRGSRSTALLRQVAAETETEEENLVLTDTAPLLISAETEYLARFVDCAIIVVESGVTTRTQLLAAAATLQRLDVAAVGLVLNRVKLAKADPAFLNSVHEIEKHHRAQSKSTSRRAERTSPLSDEPFPDAKELPRASAVASEESSQGQKRDSHPTTPSRQPTAPSWSTAAPVKPWLPQPPKPSKSNEDAELPWWLSDADGKPPAQSPRINGPYEVKPRDAEQVDTKPHDPELRPHSKPDLHPHLIPIQSWASSSPWSGDFVPGYSIAGSTVVSEAPEQPIEEKSVPAPVAVEASVVPEVVTSASVEAVAPPDFVEVAMRVIDDPEPSSDQAVVQQAAPAAGDHIVPVTSFEPVPIAAEIKDTEVETSVVPKIAETVTPIVAQRPVPADIAPISAATTDVHGTEQVPAARIADAVAVVSPQTPAYHDKPVAIQTASRLNPLRSLMSSLGLKNLNRVRHGEPMLAKAPLLGKDESDRAVIVRALSQFAERVPVVTHPTEVEPLAEQVRAVTALPEFLPPREFIPVRDTENSPENIPSSGFGRGESFDDVPTLPSRRGQYKRSG